MSLDGSINDFGLSIREAKSKAIMSASEKMAGMKGSFWAKAEKMAEALNQTPFSHQEQLFCILAAYGQQVQTALRGQWPQLTGRDHNWETVTIAGLTAMIAFVTGQTSRDVWIQIRWNSLKKEPDVSVAHHVTRAWQVFSQYKSAKPTDSFKTTFLRKFAEKLVTTLGRAHRAIPLHLFQSQERFNGVNWNEAKTILDALVRHTGEGLEAFAREDRRGGAAVNQLAEAVH